MTVEFEIGQTVFLKTDPEQLPCLVTSIRILPNDICYCISIGSNSFEVYGFEITDERNVLLGLGTRPEESN